MKWIMMVLVTSLFATLAYAAPTYYSATDHYYEAIPLLHPLGDGYTWDEASAMAESSTHLGVQGHLATITSAEENEFVADLCDAIGLNSGYWLGGYQPENSLEPEGDWRWVTGEPWGYTNWKAGEPNDAGTFGVEDHLGFVGASGHALLGQWNDVYRGLNPDRFWSSYVVEYPVPEPATLSLLIVGGLAMVQRKRKACK